MRWLTIIAVSMLPWSALAACPSDCNRDGEVQIADLLVTVSIGLGDSPLSECPGADLDYDARISIADLIAGVRAALDGCPPQPTPIPHPLLQSISAVLDQKCDARWLGAFDTPSDVGLPPLIAVSCDHATGGPMLTFNRLDDAATAAELVAGSLGLPLEFDGQPARLYSHDVWDGDPEPNLIWFFSAQLDCWHIGGRSYTDDESHGLVEVAQAIADDVGDQLRDLCQSPLPVPTDPLAQSMRRELDQRCAGASFFYYPPDQIGTPYISASCELAGGKRLGLVLRDIGKAAAAEVRDDLSPSRQSLLGFPASIRTLPATGGTAVIGCWYVSFEAGNGANSSQALVFAETLLGPHVESLVGACGK